MRYFLVKLDETNGDFGYFHYHLIEAKDKKEANKKAFELAGTMYNSEVEEYDEIFEYSNGVAIVLSGVTELTKVEAELIRKVL